MPTMAVKPLTCGIHLANETVPNQLCTPPRHRVATFREWTHPAYWVLLCIECCAWEFQNLRGNIRRTCRHGKHKCPGLCQRLPD